MPNFNGIWTADQQLQALGSSTWPSLPGAPTIGTATVASSTSVSVTFTAPSSTGYPAGITGYIVTSSPGGLTGTGASSPISVTGLTTDTAYTFTVRAINATGTGPSSAASNSVTPVNNFVEDVFSTYLYTGTGTTQTITNGIDLSTKGGLVWQKDRVSAGQSHILCDTARGVNSFLRSDLTSAAGNNGGTDAVYAFNSNGFSTGTVNGTSINLSGDATVSWTFRKQPKFFDIVTYTGDGNTNQVISHNLGSVPGCIIVKASNDVNGWYVYHRSLTTPNNYALGLSSTGAESNKSSNVWDVTSTTFQANQPSLDSNKNGINYVAYLFAHDAGGFGLTGTDNVISCGSYAGDGGAGTTSINLGFEPQWVLVKDRTSTDNWVLIDNMRGFANESNTANDARLQANTTNVESLIGALDPTATGFKTTLYTNINTSGRTYIYVAIRRGPMKVPTDATKVFNPVLAAATNPAYRSSNFTSGIDSAIEYYSPGSAGYPRWSSRLTGTGLVRTEGANAESGVASSIFTYMNGYSNQDGLDPDRGAFMFKRAPSFFDQVAYTGTGSATTLTHNLAAVPELILIKSRSDAEYWAIYSQTVGNNGHLINTNNPVDSPSGFWNTTTPTSSVISLGTGNRVNGSTKTYIAFLFATCAGVSKVGSYTGTATTKQVNCGFAAGARFVLIKRTDSTGDWYVWDTARGIVAGNDRYLLLNSTAIEVTNTDYIDTYSAGFELSSTAPAELNASGGSYIFLAIA